jgi:hypothetical protein
MTVGARLAIATDGFRGGAGTGGGSGYFIASELDIEMTEINVELSAPIEIELQPEIEVAIQEPIEVEIC